MALLVAVAVSGAVQARQRRLPGTNSSTTRSIFAKFIKEGVMVQYFSFLLLLAALPAIHTFTIAPNDILQATTSIKYLSLLHKEREHIDIANNHIDIATNQFDDDVFASRRQLFHSVAKIGIMVLGCNALPIAANAAQLSDDTIEAAVAMKTFVDPEGMFIINIPQRFFAIRRTNQGDLPNAATGSGRRGSSIFNAGDLAKAEVLAIERYVFTFY
jgi:hypothetical protein